MEATIESIKTLLNIEDSTEDELLWMLLSIAKQKILDRLYPFDDTMTSLPSRYVPKQLEIVVYLYNKRGAEGQLVHSEGGISRTYASADIPEALLEGITPTVGLR